MVWCNFYRVSFECVPWWLKKCTGLSKMPCVEFLHSLGDIQKRRIYFKMHVRVTEYLTDENVTMWYWESNLHIEQHGVFDTSVCFHARWISNLSPSLYKYTITVINTAQSPLSGHQLFSNEICLEEEDDRPIATCRRCTQFWLLCK